MIHLHATDFFFLHPLILMIFQFCVICVVKRTNFIRLFICEFWTGFYSFHFCDKLESKKKSLTTAYSTSCFRVGFNVCLFFFPWFLFALFLLYFHFKLQWNFRLVSVHVVLIAAEEMKEFRWLTLDVDRVFLFCSI